MQIVVKQKQFFQALKAVSKTINRKPHLPVLAGVQLKFSQQTLELTTTDLTAGIKVTLEANVRNTGKVVVVGKTILSAVSFFEEELTEMVVAEKKLQLQNGRDKVNIPLLSDDYPDFFVPQENIKFYLTKLSFWQKLAKNVAFAASSDQVRPVLTAVLLRLRKEKSQLVCTDGFRLMSWELPQALNFAFENDLLLSTKALLDVVALAGEQGETELEFACDSEGEQFFFRGREFCYFSKLISGNYPPFEKIIPLEFAHQATLDGELFLKNLTKAGVFSKTESNTVNLSFSSDKVLFSSQNSSDGSFLGEQELISFTGEPIDISFNIRYLQDFINSMAGEVLWFGCNDAVMPAAFRDLADNSLQYIVMPFKPKNNY